MPGLEDIRAQSVADFAIMWQIEGKKLHMKESAGMGNQYIDISEMVSFKPGDYLLGKAYTDSVPLLVEDVSSTDDTLFIRKSQALQSGVKSLAFLPGSDSVVELGFMNTKLSIPTLEGGGFVVEDHAKIIASIPGIQGITKSVNSLMAEIGYIPNRRDAPDPRDHDNVDKWVPRDPRLNRLTGIHPFNCEAPLSVLREHKYLTPASLHYVRNHGICPKLFWSSHSIEITGLVDRPMRLSMDELMKLPKISVPVTLNCAGNRRKEQNLIQKGIGFNWGCAAASTVVWTGIPLREILKHVGIQHDARWVNFAGPEGEVPQGDTTYGASHASAVCMNPARPCMLAFMMNGELLHPDHGYPVRLLMPGYIGGRMIKWLTTITVTKDEGDNHYHIYDNRVFPKHISSKEIATEEKIWTDPAYTINDRNINSTIWAPAHCAKILVSEGMYTLRGYAYAGAGRPVHRVEVTLNNAQNWRLAKIERFEEPDEFGQCWCWVFWSVDVPISALAKCGEFAVRAWDDSQNCQPERPTWNLMGMMNNPWFRIKVHALGDSHIWFEHPTQVDNRHSIDSSAPLCPMNEELHLLPNGNLASPGWMERMVDQVQAVYAPGKPETLDEQEGWEREKQHMISQQAPSREAPGCMDGLQGLFRSFLESVFQPASNYRADAAAGSPPAAKTAVMRYTMGEVSKHNIPTDCWIVVNGDVLDVTSFIKDHPGGDKPILGFAGKDASTMFNPIHSSTVISEFAPSAVIGKLVQ